MPDRYTSLVTALKALTQSNVTLPMAEDEWNTRPDTVSYGTISLDFEAGSLNGDDAKQDTAYSGSVDLYSLVRTGAGWVELITQTLMAHCGPCWSLNLHTYERETTLFHWEWTFEVDDSAVHSEDDGDEGSPGNAGSAG